MFKQLQNMYGIPQSQNQSQTQQQIPLTIPFQTIAKLKLYKQGTQQQQQHDIHAHKQAHQLDLDQYLQTQRLNSKSNNKKINKPKTAQQLQKQKQFRQGYGKGFKMLQKMGFNINKGLGKNQQGRTNIIQAQFKTSLTKRDQDYQQQNQKIQQQQKQQVNPYNQYQFEQLFQYKSRNIKINNLLVMLKNKYEVLKNKVQIIGKDKQNYVKEVQMSVSFKLQKINQVRDIEEEIVGLESIGKSTSSIEKYPHLALLYNADLLVIKEAVEKLQPMGLHKVSTHLQQQIQKIRSTLNSLYLSKQKQSLKQYNQSTGFQRNFLKNFQNNKNTHKNMQPNKNVDDDIIFVSQQDQAKINKYISFIIQEAVIKNKLQIYLNGLNQIQKCQNWVIDLMDIIYSADVQQQVCKQLKAKYLIPKANDYLMRYKYQPAKKLPHLVIFPWMMIIKLDQLYINKFIYNLVSRLWSIQNDDLFNIINPWLKHINKNDKQFFMNFYLAPRLLFQMETFDLEAPSSKNKIKGFLKYSELLPIEMRKQIIQNSLALILLNKYKKQLKEDPNQAEDLKIWVKRWAQKFDKVCDGAIKQFFIENKEQAIWY